MHREVNDIACLHSGSCIFIIIPRHHVRKNPHSRCGSSPLLQPLSLCHVCSPCWSSTVKQNEAPNLMAGGLGVSQRRGHPLSTLVNWQWGWNGAGRRSVGEESGEVTWGRRGCWRYSCAPVGYAPSPFISLTLVSSALEKWLSQNWGSPQRTLWLSPTPHSAGVAVLVLVGGVWIRLGCKAII